MFTITYIPILVRTEKIKFKLTIKTELTLFEVKKKCGVDFLKKKNFWKVQFKFKFNLD